MVRNALRKAALSSIPNQMLRQVESLRVVGVCECGCASLYFRAPAAGDARVADGLGSLPSGERVEILVWAPAGHLSSLELVDHAGRGTMPTAESVCSWEEAGEREARK